MLILGVDTSTSQVGVALGGGDGVIAEVRLTGARRHAEQLPPAIQYVLAESGVSLRDLDALAVGVGPGLFTGLRVGVTTVKVMAQALERPVVPVPSLDLLAQPIVHHRGWIVPVIDARRGEVYTASYWSNGEWLDKPDQERVLPPSQLADELRDSGLDVLLVGNGAIEYESIFLAVPGASIAGPAFAHPSAAALIEVAAERFERGECSDAHDVVPLYLRKSDAELAAPGAAG